MTKKIVVSVCAVLLAGLALSSYASMQKAKVSEPELKQETSKIILYNAPNGSILSKFRPDKRFVPIYQQGEWVKVGNPTDGKIGWINAKQVDQARDNYFRPDIQTLFVQRAENKNGKPILNIVAYRNGKKVSEKEAQQLYQSFRHQEQQQYRKMQRMSMWLDEINDQFWADLPSPWAAPMVKMQ